MSAYNTVDVKVIYSMDNSIEKKEYVSNKDVGVFEMAFGTIQIDKVVDMAT